MNEKRIPIRSVIDFHDDATLAVEVSQEDAIRAVRTVMPNISHMTRDEQLQVLDMLGLIETRVQPGDWGREARRSKERRKRASAKERTGYARGFSRAKRPEDRGTPGPAKGTPSPKRGIKVKKDA